VIRTFVDSDILIWHLRGDPNARGFFEARIEEGSELWIGALQRAEVTFFMREREVPHTLHFLSHFKTAPVTQDVVDDGATLYRHWNRSHGVDVNDAILAATVMARGGRIFTLNLKHYPMPDLPVYRGW
jgi:hypothetical protein